MAVSQYLRPGTLLQAVSSQLTSDVVRSASSFISEPESSTRQAMNAATPSVLSGLANMVSSREGANSLAGMIRDGGYGAAAENVRSLFAGGNATNNMVGAGHNLLNKIFGARLPAVTDLVANSSGVTVSSASKLLSLTAPLTLGILAKRAASQRLDASGLANAILEERPDFASAAPSGLSQILGSGPTLVVRPSETVSEHLAEPVHLERVHELEPALPAGARPARWLPLALAVLAALALLLFLRSRTARSNLDNIASQTTSAARDALARVELPGGGAISVAKGTINYNLAAFLADKSAAGVPQTFVFDHLNFDSATTRLTPESVPTVNDLATVLKAYPSARVQLIGHTDNTGTADANQSLSLDRANAVKTMLVSQGVAADRISTAGFGQDRPIASNDTEGGRAQNRRLELVVNSK
jgi:outer membrane protein OmpA-like peptidoglycan-associated protein